MKIKVLRGHTDAVNSCEFFYDDSRIVTASNDKSIRLWVCVWLSIVSCLDMEAADIIIVYVGP